MRIAFFKRVLMAAMLLSIASPIFAEDAPVFDVDNYPPQFDGQSDAGTASSPISAPPAAQPSASVEQQQYVPPPQPLNMDQRVNRIEQQMTNLEHSDAAAKLNAMQSEVQSLRGQVEELTHTLQQMQGQQKAMYSDLDKRLSQQMVNVQAAPAGVSLSDDASVKTTSKVKPSVIKAKPKSLAPATAPQESVIADTPDVSSAAPKAAKAIKNKVAAADNLSAMGGQEELNIYQTAYDLIKAKKYDAAIATLQKMLSKYPSGQFAANAHYWLGELYGLQSKNAEAAVEFAKVVKNYPDSPKVSDAQLKLGMIYAAEFKWAEAKSTFRKVITHYPGSTPARLATQQLREIKTAGH